MVQASSLLPDSASRLLVVRASSLHALHAITKLASQPPMAQAGSPIGAPSSLSTDSEHRGLIMRDEIRSPIPYVRNRRRSYRDC